MTSDHVMTRGRALGNLGTRPFPGCPVCGTPGLRLYAGLPDRLFGAPGAWDIKRCLASACGMLWLDPRPLEEDLGEAYRSYYTHEPIGVVPSGALRRAYRWFKEGYYGIRFGYPVTPPTTLKRVLGVFLYLAPDLRENLDLRVMHLHARPGGRLLDVGCGSGHALLFMRDLGWQVEGVDVDPSAVEQACSHGLDVHVGTLAAQRYPDRAFDAVMMNHVIEHVPDPVDLLRECHRILRPGGQLQVVTPNVSSWGHSIFRDRWRGLEPPRHLQIFTPAGLHATLARASFRVVSIRTSARLAAMIRRESVSPELAARGRPAPPSVRDSLFLAAAYLRLVVAPQGGEEIVAAADR